MSRRSPAFSLLLAALLVGCATERPPSRPDVSPSPGACAGGEIVLEEGTASWYGSGHHGRRTASGAVFDMNSLTAAHRTLPFGTPIVVSNLENGRTTSVLVNDRGPFVDGRILDVSRRAASDLGFVGAGIARVRIACATTSKQ